MIKFKEILFLKNLKRIGKATIYKNYWKILNEVSSFEKLVSKISLESRFTNDDIDKAVSEAEMIYDSVVDDPEITVITVFDEDYPEKLDIMGNKRPLILYFKGDASSIIKPNIAFIGTRKPSKLAMDFEEKMVRAILDKQDRVIVSGLALGCDKIAHQTTVDENRLTVAVLPSGVDVISPASNKKLAQSIIETGGCLLSEYEPGKRANKGSFIERDAIVAALCDATFVVECGVKSGTMHTVNSALEYERPVYSYLPADRPKDAFDGNQFILENNESAILIENVDDFFDSPAVETPIKSKSGQQTLF